MTIEFILIGIRLRGKLEASNEYDDLLALSVLKRPAYDTYSNVSEVPINYFFVPYEY